MADDSFQHILRVLNTNVDGKQKIMFALTAIRGIGRRFSNIVCKKAEVDMTKRSGFHSWWCSRIKLARWLEIVEEQPVYSHQLHRHGSAVLCCAKLMLLLARRT